MNERIKLAVMVDLVHAVRRTVDQHPELVDLRAATIAATATLDEILDYAAREENAVDADTEEVAPADRDYQPGNGSAYDLALVPDRERLLLVWVGHGSMAIHRDDPPHWRYVAEKLRASEPDAAVIAEWAARHMPVPR